MAVNECIEYKDLKGSEYFLIWNASEEEAERIAKEKAAEDIDYNNCDADINGIDAFVWSESN